MTDVIYAIQVAIAVLISLWIYDRLAKRWTATLGDDVVTGTVTSVGYVASEGGGVTSLFRMLTQSKALVSTVPLTLRYGVSMVSLGRQVCTR